MGDYWSKRLADKAYESNSEDMLKQLRRLYRSQAKAIQDKITDLYITMLESGGITTTNLYAYGRYAELMRGINGVLKKYGEQEEKIITGGLENAYRETFGKTSQTLGQAINWGLQNTYMMEEVVNANFKGAGFSQRIWKNRNSLCRILEKSVQDVVAAGMSKDKAVRELMLRHNTSFSNADRLVRTEVMRVINDGQKQAYLDKGYTHGYYIYSDDDRNCDECARIAKESRREPVPLADMEAVHHPRCRCTIRPVVPPGPCRG